MFGPTARGGRAFRFPLRNSTSHSLLTGVSSSSQVWSVHTHTAVPPTRRARAEVRPRARRSRTAAGGSSRANHLRPAEAGTMAAARMSALGIFTCSLRLCSRRENSTSRMERREVLEYSNTR